MNGMLWCHGWQGTAMFRMAFLRHPVFQSISASMHVNGQIFSSRQNLSTYINVGNAVVPWMARNSDVQDGLSQTSSVIAPALLY
jgi:hypothetical protein